MERFFHPHLCCIGGCHDGKTGDTGSQERTWRMRKTTEPDPWREREREKVRREKKRKVVPLEHGESL